jgi:hypothetical protein
MIDNAIEGDRSITLRRPRFRFGLKALFVLMTIVCLWLGNRMIRERRAAEMIAGRDRVIQIVTANIATPPTDTFYRINPGSQDELLQEAQWPGPEHWRRAILDTGSTGLLATWTLVLDVSKSLESVNRAGVVQQLVDHYARRFARHRLDRRERSGGGSNLGGGYARAVWTTAGNEFTVIIDAEVDAEVSTAEVRILVIDAQQLRVW